MNFSKNQSELSRHWSSLRSRLPAGKLDLIAVAVLVLMVTGAALVVVGLCAS
jgi:hypothetical protein